MTLQLGSINYQNVSSCPLCQMCMCLTFLSPTVSLFSLLRYCYCVQYRVFISHLCVPRCINSKRPVHPRCFLLFNHSSTFLYMSLYSRLFFLPDPLCSPMVVSPFLCFIHNVLLFGRYVVGGAHAIAFLFHLKKYSSCRVNPKWIIYHSIVSTDRQYMRNVISIDPSWLREAAPQFYQNHRHNATGH